MAERPATMRAWRARLGRLLLTALLAAAWAAALPARAQAQEVWFAPSSPHPKVPGLPDWGALFSPDAPWKKARAATRVFQFDGTYVMYYPPSEVRERAAFLAQHGIDVSVAIQPVTRDANPICGGGVEGFDDPRSAPRIADNLKAAGVALRYVTMDGALTFGHYYDGPRACRYDVAQIVDRVATAARAFLDRYPDVTLIDVESSGLIERPGFADQFRRFKAGFEAATGRKLEIVQLDMAWPDATWPDHLRRWRALARDLGLRLGIIYNGDGLDPTGEAWTAHAIRNFATIEDTIGFLPAQAIFAGWNKVPTHVLPETSPATRSYPVAQYGLARTRLTLTAQHGRIMGRLQDADGRGIPHAPVQVSDGFDAHDPVPVHVWTGPVPAGATEALLAVRINMECGCAPTESDIVLGPLTYQESGSGTVRFQFDPGLALARARNPDPHRPQTEISERGGVTFSRIVTRPDQTLGLNSERFRVTPGAEATFRVPMGAMSSAGMAGAVSIIWLNAEGKGLLRSSLIDHGDFLDPVTVTTDSDGTFLLPHYGGPRSLRATFGGDALLRPAFASWPRPD